MKLSQKPSERPYVILSTAMSLDGFIVSKDGDNNLSNTHDWRRVHKLRLDSDAIMVGSNTIRIDDPKLTVKEKYVTKTVIKHPVRIVVTSDANIPLDAKIIRYRPEVKTIIATTSKCSTNQIRLLEGLGCDVLICGNGPLVDLIFLLKSLKNQYHIDKLMLEGGGTLNSEMLKIGCIDEIHLSIAPIIFGSGIKIFANWFSDQKQFPTFHTKKIERVEDMISLILHVQYEKRNIC
ncbi:MAG: RibD family protein [Candidatus Hodarchaeales archaeon]